MRRRGEGNAGTWHIPLLALAVLACGHDDGDGTMRLVDHADLSADLLQPLLQSAQVKVQSYRKLKWGGKTGLLLDAA